MDGHIVLSRKLARSGHFPAIDVLTSLSRTMPSCTAVEHQRAARRVRRSLATWEENEELVRLGAYTRGNNPEVDAALELYPHLEGFLTQRSDESEPPGRLPRPADPAGTLIVATRPRPPRGRSPRVDSARAARAATTPSR